MQLPPPGRAQHTGIAIAVLIACSSWATSKTVPPNQPPSATKITAANVHQLQQQGPDAWGGIGDWHLSNGKLCATISAVDHESDLSSQGGSLIDLGFCERADDQIVVLHDLLDGSTGRPINAHRIEAINHKNTAAIRVFSGANGFAVETTFSVDANQPTQLQIHKTISRRHDDAPDFFIYVPVFFNYFSMPTFVLDSREPQRSSGFKRQAFFDKGVSNFGDAAQDADTIIAIGAKGTGLPIAYGWRLRSATRTSAGESEALPSFALSDQGSTIFLIPARPFFFGDGEELGLPQLLELPIMGLTPGDQIELHETLYIGERSDVAAITDQLFPDAPLITGQLNDPAGVVHIDHAQGPPFSFSTTNAAGEFALHVPQGEYRITAAAPGQRQQTQDFKVPSTGEPTPAGAIPALQLSLPPLAKPNRILLPEGAAMRLVFKGVGATPDPHLDDPLTGFTIFDADTARPTTPVNAVFLTGEESDPSFIDVAPGNYRVFATRGIEYEVTQASIEVSAGGTHRLEIEIPTRSFATPGFIAADLHVHSAPSMDNGFPVIDRARTFVAETGEVMVAAEHETVYDYAPLLETMNLTQKMVAIAGTEMTGQVPTARMPHSSGHANFFPLPPIAHAFRKGIPDNEGRRLRDILFELQTRDPGIVTQLNHARDSDKFLVDPAPDPTTDVSERIDNSAYFDHMGPAGHPFNPHQSITSYPNNTLIETDPITGIRDIDFTSMEILNGTHSYSPTRRRALMADWMALLNQGIRIFGAANSDSHNKTQQVALPRNMVAITDDRVSEFNPDEFFQSLKNGRSYGTTGPILDLSLGGKQFGETFSGNSASLTGRVRTASWVDVNQLRVLVNGKLLHAQEINPSSTNEQTFDVELAFSKDSQVVVELEGVPSDVYETVYPGQIPYAFSNPIFVDADSDGEWQAPGL